MYQLKEKLETRLTILVSLVIIGFTRNVLALIAAAFHLCTFVPSVRKLPICAEGVFESQPERILNSARHHWHTNPSNLSGEGCKSPAPSRTDLQDIHQRLSNEWHPFFHQNRPHSEKPLSRLHHSFPTEKVWIMFRA
jgi:hypothetical protein